MAHDNLVFTFVAPESSGYDKSQACHHAIRHRFPGVVPQPWNGTPQDHLDFQPHASPDFHLVWDPIFKTHLMMHVRKQRKEHALSSSFYPKRLLASHPGYK